MRAHLRSGDGALAQVETNSQTPRTSMLEVQVEGHAYVCPTELHFVKGKLSHDTIGVTVNIVHIWSIPESSMQDKEWRGEGTPVCSELPDVVDDL
eukprot:636129-Pleurochrysis_carterae.AAC.1